MAEGGDGSTRSHRFALDRSCCIYRGTFTAFNDFRLLLARLLPPERPTWDKIMELVDVRPDGIFITVAPPMKMRSATRRPYMCTLTCADCRTGDTRYLITCKVCARVHHPACGLLFVWPDNKAVAGLQESMATNVFACPRCQTTSDFEPSRKMLRPEKLDKRDPVGTLYRAIKELHGGRVHFSVESRIQASVLADCKQCTELKCDFPVPPHCRMYMLDPSAVTPGSRVYKDEVKQWEKASSQSGWSPQTLLPSTPPRCMTPPKPGGPSSMSRSSPAEPTKTQMEAKRGLLQLSQVASPLPPGKRLPAVEPKVHASAIDQLAQSLREVKVATSSPAAAGVVSGSMRHSLFGGSHRTPLRGRPLPKEDFSSPEMRALMEPIIPEAHRLQKDQAKEMERVTLSGVQEMLQSANFKQVRSCISAQAQNYNLEAPNLPFDNLSFSYSV
jgi:hypothetical protein